VDKRDRPDSTSSAGRHAGTTGVPFFFFALFLLRFARACKKVEKSTPIEVPMAAPCIFQSAGLQECTGFKIYRPAFFPQNVR